MVNRIAAAGLQVRPYFYRYGDDALDLCDVLGSYVPGAKVKLDEVSKILRLTGKPEGVDGSRVEEMVVAGQIEEVARYCESDVLNTYRVWLVYELFRGCRRGFVQVFENDGAKWLRFGPLSIVNTQTHRAGGYSAEVIFEIEN
jgi:Predicted 3'-5' exonuclease related to the exonuclease domain of PolB